MSNKSGTSEVISLPKGGGAQKGIGETFSPDLHTGTGNFSVPIALPAGRNGFQPELTLVYSTGNGNSCLGLGWQLSIPGVSRKTSKGIPRYFDGEANKPQDTFLLSGAEDLVPVGKGENWVQYRPRTEGLFAIIRRYLDLENDYWEVKSKDGLVSWYGTPGERGGDLAVVFNPDGNRIFCWKLSATQDPFCNRIEYGYLRDKNELYLQSIRYLDYINENGVILFLASVEFKYEDRPDPFTVHTSGFEIRTTQRCQRIETYTHPDAQPTKVRSYDLVYDNDPFNRVSFLKAVQLIGYDGDNTETLPPLTFGYTAFEPTRKKFLPVGGKEFPLHSLGNPDTELIDLDGNGLPDIVQMNGVVRYWKNLGNCQFDQPRTMRNAPAGVRLGDPNVQFMDANGEGRADLVVHNNGMSGYFPTTFEGEWDKHSFRKHRLAPTFNFQDPEVKLVDLNGDGITDLLRSGSRMECFFNDPEQGWNDLIAVERKDLDVFPNVNLSDPRVRLADMSGDGLQDIVLIHDGNVEYWPHMGYGRWGKRRQMRNSPRFPLHYDPKRILLGDIAGDGLHDIIYVDNSKVTIWINQNGNGFCDPPIEITGTPSVTDMDAIRLEDMLGTGTSGILWSADQRNNGREHYFFLDLTGGIKPFVLNEMNNHTGAITKVEYKPSTYFYQQDAKKRETRWKTPLPFPVQVVSCVEVIDEISKNKLTTEYSYHHGYWDGVEREFRGFGRVEQVDTQIFANYSTSGLHGEVPFQEVAEKFYTPPTLTKTWFHQGPVGEASGEWKTLDYDAEYWEGDPQKFNQATGLYDLVKRLPRRAQRDFYRTLQGSVLHTELYALDSNEERENRPYTVTESFYIARQEFRPEDAPFAKISKGTSGYIFLPLLNIARTTQWERGNDPMTQFSFTEDWDAFGHARVQIAVACPRGWRNMGERVGETTPFLSTYSKTQLAYSDTETPYIKGRTAKTSAFEILHRGEQIVWDIKAAINDPNRLELLSQSLSYYDGAAFEGLPFGKIGQYGVPVRSESIIIDEKPLQEAYKSGKEPSDPPELPPYLIPDSPPNWTNDYPQAFRDTLPPLAGYTFHDGSGEQARGYWAQSSSKFDFHELGMPAKGLPLVQRDALNRETTIRYDSYHFLPAQVTDPLGLTIKAEYDYRLFQAKLSSDPNDNVSMLRFSPLGFVKETFLIGKEGVMEGDALDRNDANALPSASYLYDFHAFDRERQPIFVKTIAQEHHRYETDVLDEQRGDTITTIEFSDGFGRLVQTRVQAEDMLFGDERFGTGLLPPDPDGATTPMASIGKIRKLGEPENVVVSGWKIYNNKGLVVQQYEPYYDKGFAYATPEDYQFGKKSEMYYDPRGQVIRTLNPDGSEQRVIYGIPANPNGVMSNAEMMNFIPTPWEAYTYDANDLAPLCTGSNGISLAGRAPEEHHFTPASIEIDAMGRTVKAVARQRNLRKVPDDPLPPLEEYKTFSTYDIRGNLLTVTDALGRTAFRYTYDLTFDKENGSRVWRIESIDAGLRRITFHVLGMEIERRDSKGSLTLQTHDRGNRLTQLWASNYQGESITLRQHLLYGDTTPQSPEVGILDGNFEGKLFRHYDEAGLVEVYGYDFKGNPLASSRRTIRNEVVRPFLGSVNYTAFTVDWSSPDAETYYLETTRYRSDSIFDALNRPKRITYPEDVTGERKVLLPAYNRAGALESIALLSPLAGGQAGELAGVRHIAYNAKGQRTLIAYANSLMTRYEYEPDTFRLARMRTEKYEHPDDVTFQPKGGLLQDLAYSYDLGGNITRIRDRGTGKGINGVFPFNRDFGYDALYRLVDATGIEHNAYAHSGEPWLEIMQHYNDDMTQARRYRQQYTYDPMGNMLELRHRNLQGEAGHYTRTFQPLVENNRLFTMEQGGITSIYAYDPNGNMTLEATNRRYHWNHSDQLDRFRNQPSGSAPTVDACYLYGADGMRVKKIVLNGGTLLRSTTYIGDAFEYHTEVQGGQEKTNNTLHVMDGKNRIALVRVGVPFDLYDDSPAVQYQLGDHLGNVQFVVNEYGTLHSREEHYPYSGTSFGGFEKKRYRFTGKERDEESGLSYHGARYYKGWLGRWVSADSIGMEGGTNLYRYAKGNPVIYFDSTGNNDESLYNSNNLTCDTSDECRDQSGNSDLVRDENGNFQSTGEYVTQSTDTDDVEEKKRQEQEKGSLKFKMKNKIIEQVKANNRGQESGTEKEKSKTNYEIGKIWKHWEFEKPVELEITDEVKVTATARTKGIKFGASLSASESEGVELKAAVGYDYINLKFGLEAGPVEAKVEAFIGIGVDGKLKLGKKIGFKGKIGLGIGVSVDFEIDLEEICDTLGLFVGRGEAWPTNCKVGDECLNPTTSTPTSTPRAHGVSAPTGNNPQTGGTYRTWSGTDMKL